ncbi:MAG TPA: MFS transporter [Caulobacteraceae bacterium]|nr:MFS transporter [Caulobacteraceae bacterium]
MNALDAAPLQLKKRPASTPEQVRQRAFFLLFCVSVTTALGNSGMQSVLPAIGRQIGIPDPMVAAIFSLSALLWALVSPFWARQSDLHGRKPLILLGLAGFMLSMIACGVVVSAGVRHLAAPMIIFGFFLLGRAVFGLFGSASNPATQAYVAERTSRRQRTQAMSTLAGAFGLGTIVGPLIATLFVLPVVGLAGPLFAFAVIAAIMLLTVAHWLPESKALPEPLDAEERKFVPAEAEAHMGEPATLGAARPGPLWRDPRLTPFLAYGFLIASWQSIIQQILGFLIIDKVGLPPIQALDYTKMAWMTGAIAGLLAQWGLIRMFAMSPRHLLRWGAGLAAAGSLLMAFAPDYWTVVIAFALCNLGFAFARPGFTAGSSLAVRPGEQAAAAGAIAAVNGVNIIFAPFFVGLYGRVHIAPFLVILVVLAGLAAFAFLNPTLRRAGENPASEEDATVSLLERHEEG